ncbi:alcohol dehydrogenase class IV [Methanolinea mesophila]|uniref:alcohol dehydrogenase-like regulatory protein ErcA n=1 Tax=Methanolinea mesophila TaxID=547055 RepID=UPI001AE4BA61|nr:alcohol dehydrogenase-like regulatory protein ErcA [Methanolinea mesophila]MBP1928970.1 alcohol dehydrogenase class IV [Methanolinea mesophila]
MIGTGFELRKFVAPEFVIGADARTLAGRYARNLGARHVLLVTGPDITKEWWHRDVTASLEAEGIEYTTFSEVSENPRDFQVMKGAECYAEAGCDAIVVVGGGSPIDCAKGIAIVSSNKRNILEFEGVDNVPVPAPPLVCIPTTAGTSADVSQFAIINDTNRKVKIAIISKAIVPDIALIDPVPLTTLSPELTAHTGMDAITHSVEAYVSNASSPVTDLQALESVRLMHEALLPAQADPTNLGCRYKTMLGSLYAGLAFSNASLGAVHAMAHSLGGFSDLPHGECNALLLEHVVAYNFAVCPGRYETIGKVLGVESGDAGPEEKKRMIVSAIASLRERLGVTETLRDLGVTRDDIPALARNAMHDPCMATNPRPPTQSDIERIYSDAL